MTGASHNNMNQLVSQQAGGALVFKGTVSEPATVTVGGTPATVTTDNRFEGQAEVPEGTGQVQVAATDPSGNVRTSTYEVSQAGTPKAFTYDLNGHMTSDGTRTYEWDAENRLVAVKEGATTVASFTYNRRGIRTSKTVAGETTTYFLEGNSVVEERQSTGGVTKHFQGPGIDNVLAMQDGVGATTYLTRDHLGSIREHVDSAGALTLRRDYDPWGRVTTGAGVGGRAFTGRENDAEIGLHYYRARYYSPEVGRFVSEDPAVLTFDATSYTYVHNDPVGRIDPSGLYDRHARNDIAIQAMRKIWPACQKLRARGEKEYVGNICDCDGKLLWGKAIKQKSGLAVPPCAKGKMIGAYHCHPPGDRAEYFSDEDQDLVLFKGLDVVYLLTPSGLMKWKTKSSGGDFGRLEPTSP